MKEKTITILICILIALSILGFAYAQWNDVITISNTMEFGHLTIRFVEPLKFWDNDDTTKDVGKIYCEYVVPDPEGGFENLTVAITNAYPGYEAYCNFTLKNIGTMTEHIDDVVIIPGTGLEVGETYLDTNGKPIGWRLDDTLTKDTILYVHVYNRTSMSLVCNMIWPSDDPLTPEIEPVILEAKIVVLVTQNAQECHVYSFKVEIIDEQVIP